MESFDAVAARIIESGLPVFFPDTCVLLDVVRATKRRLTGCVDAASDLAQMCSDVPQRCLVVISSVVDHEWTRHSTEVVEEVQNYLMEIESQSSYFHDACRTLGVTVPFQRASYSTLGVADALFGLCRRLVHAAACLAADGSTKEKAFDRVLKNTPPSKKGGEVKDCAILEDYLEVCRRVRAGGFRGKLVFCTSNSTDFCTAGSRPHPNLASDYAAVGLTFTSNLSWAVHELQR